MAEVCFECYNKELNYNYTRKQLKFTRYKDTCYFCQKQKQLVRGLTLRQELRELRADRKEYRQTFGKPYIPSIKTIIRNWKIYK